MKNIGIAIAAPGGYALDDDAVARGIARLEQQGCTVHNYYDPAQKHLRFGGTDAGRLAQLEAAARDPDVQVVIALRGQYGISRILPRIDFRLMADSGKLFVGYSDVTAFHMGLMAATGRKSFAGPMICDDFIRDEPVDYTLDQFRDCLRGPTHHVRGTAEGNPRVDVEGRLWGGNLAMLTHLAGTPYFARIPNGIVFIEDINEHPYRVERMVLQLLYSGALEGQRALVLGDFSGYRLAPFDNGYDFDAMLAYLRETLPIPVLTGLPFGHVKHRCTLPFGGLAHLVSDETGFDLTVTDYPTLARPDL
ncbi:muramoyltetrapeptide carboxypeptidase [Pseudoduganella flava]|uniref:Muramoyltetrapeptide carboxypeptidase n=1 Tax=Pseudoduganella flava TaxID=871742 RepID=A0A562PPX9_9BURK|nr:muramoyltetrapeptide carboxypeptidase [Pseudoduganella flava]QGZ37711.1 muramoyltetrapeptide carboxypeptidase [Pseudoduganella flava]TWI46511.1 muramoyltetrapeptide carboxypeptidase [Pseudoduganella flava]